MAVFTITINDPVFEKKSAEVQYLLKVLDTLKNELGRGRGNVTSVTIVGTNHLGAANSSLGTWTYTPSASLP